MTYQDIAMLTGIVMCLVVLAALVFWPRSY